MSTLKAHIRVVHIEGRIAIGVRREIAKVTDMPFLALGTQHVVLRRVEMTPRVAMPFSDQTPN